MTSRRPSKISMAMLALLGASLVSPHAMAADKTAAEYYEDAVVHYGQGDYKTSTIQLRNALQVDPNLLQARLLLGLALVRQGNGVAAEEELLKANKLGADRSLTVIALAQAYLEQLRYRDLLANIQTEGFNQDTRAELLALRGQAYLELREFNDAAKAFAEAEQVNPKSASPLIGRATLLLRQGQLAEAKTQADRAVTLAPKEADAWNIKASVSHAMGQRQQAVEEYGHVLELRPEHYIARLARASLLLELNRNPEAAADLKLLREDTPYEPRASFLYSEAMARLGAPEASRTALSDAVSIIDAMPPEILSDNPQILLVGGFANYRLKQMEKARGFLSRYLEIYPRDLNARELLASIFLENKDTIQAIETLKPALAWAPEDISLLGQLGSAYMEKGRYEDAIALLEKAVKLSGGAADLRTKLAFGRLGGDQQDAAMQELSGVLRQDAKQTPAAMVLTVLHMKRNEYAKAVEVAEKLIAAQPKNPTFLNLLASAQVGAGDYKSARANYEMALAENPQFLTARINLGKLSRIEGKPEAAESIFMDVLREKPGQAQSLIELALLENQRKQPDKAIVWLEKARATNPKSVEARLDLTRLYLSLNRPADALSPIQEAEILEPNNPEVLALNSQCQMANGKPKVAQVVLQKLSRTVGYDTDWLLKAAEMQLAIGEKADALWSLEKAVQGNPESLPAREALTETFLLSGQMEKAEESAAAMQAKVPGNAVTPGVLGDLRMRQGRYQEAAASYRKAQELKPSALATIHLSQALGAAGDKQGALEALQSWLKAHPDDTDVAHVLADSYLAAGRLPEARDRYEQVLRKHPNDAPSLNNLANTLFKLGDTKAIEYARKAQAVAPDNPLANDTLGWITVQRGNPLEGLTYLRSAQSRASGNPEIRYHVAATLERLGRREEAIKELDGVLKSGQSFESLEEARELRNKLAP